MGNSKKKKKCPCCKMNIAGGNSGLLSHMKKSSCRRMILKCHGCDTEFATSEHLANHQHYQQIKDPNTSCIQGMDKLHHVQVLSQVSNQFNVQKSKKVFSVEQIQPPSSLNTTSISNSSSNVAISNQSVQTISNINQSNNTNQCIKISSSMSTSFMNSALQQYNQITFPNIQSTKELNINSTDITTTKPNNHSTSTTNTNYYGVSHSNNDVYTVDSDVDDTYYKNNLVSNTSDVFCDESLLNEMKDVFDNDDYDASDCSINDYVPIENETETFNSVSNFSLLWLF